MTNPRPMARQAQSAAETICATWYQSYGQAVYGYVRFHLDSADAADDVTSETFLKACQSVGRFDASRGSPRVWIFRIARNCLRDYLRRARVRRHVPLGAMRDLATAAASPEERVLWEEEAGRLLDGVALLGERDRELIGLRYGSGMDYAAIGEVLGASETAIRTRLWRALRRLRAHLDDGG